MKHTLILFYCLFYFIACTSEQTPIASEKKLATFISQEKNDFGDYWYQGKAEVNSYELKQFRYGEPRNGDAVLVFVTEDFSKSKQVKLDYSGQAGTDKVSVLKLNYIKKFNTGIYDYSMMQSTFSPIDLNNHQHALKTTTTSQDWCGHSFTQFNLKDNQYQIAQNSYFESEGDVRYTVEKVWLEDELMNALRMNPQNIPTGNIKLIPATFFTRLAHTEMKPKQAQIDIKKGAKTSTLALDYLHVNRSVKIDFETAFPHKILSWSESNGRGETTMAILKRSIQTDYWSKNSNQYENMREDLQLTK